MKRMLLSALLLLPLLTFAEPLFTDGFESGMAHWKNLNSPAKITLSSECATGKGSLEVSLHSKDKGNRKWGGIIASEPIPVSKGLYRLRANLQFTEGYGCWVGVDFFNTAGKRISGNGIHYGSKPASTTEWHKLEIDASAYDESITYAQVKIAMPLWADQVLRMDDVELTRLPHSSLPLPWEAQYKIRPEEKAKLTAADFPGPDGIVYPDFSRAGVRAEFHDRNDVPVLKLSDFGVRANDEKDCSVAFEEAIAALPKKGGVIELAPGRYRLSRLLTIRRDGVTIRGAGKDRTFLDLDYEIGEKRVDLYGLHDGATISSNETIHLYANPQQLSSLHLELDGKEFRKWGRSLHSGNQSFLTTQLPSKTSAGAHTLTGIAKYSDGSEFKQEIAITVDPAKKPGLPSWTPMGYINFQGNGFVGKDFLLAKDGVRGSSVIELQDSNHTFRVGDTVLLRALETPRRRKENKNACNWGSFRTAIFFVKEVNGKQIMLNQPMRIDYPIIDDAFLRKVETVKGGAVEGMTIETKNDYWLSSVLFRYATDCRAKDLKVINCGRNPVYSYNAKFCSILDCEFDGAKFKGGGGTAYVGWESSYDCLMDGVVTRGMRHAPMVQWSASGNVIRNGVFHNSDAQWHSGWTNENLFENCVVISDTKENGGYGNAFWASAPEDGSHGPNGPRNVVYNCDTYSISTAVWLGGMNENWIFVYNRLRAKSGAGFFIKTASFDHILKGNVVILEDKSSPFLLFGTPDCSGVELIDNTLSGGNGKLFRGIHEPSVERGNKIVPLDLELARPTPEAPSLYEWQKKHDQ